MSLNEACFSVVAACLNKKSGNAPSAGIVAAAVIALGTRPHATAAASTVRRLMNTDSGVISEGLIPASNLLLILLTDWSKASRMDRDRIRKFCAAPATACRQHCVPARDLARIPSCSRLTNRLDWVLLASRPRNNEVWGTNEADNRSRQAVSLGRRPQRARGRGDPGNDGHR